MSASRWFKSILLLGLASAAWAEPLSPLVEVPLEALNKAPAGSRFYRLSQLKALFTASPAGWRILHEQAGGRYKVLDQGPQDWFGDGPELKFDWFKRPHGAGFVLHTGTAVFWEGMVFPKGTQARPVHWSLNGRLVRADYDQLGVFCVDVESRRYRWTGSGFKRR